jgi:glycosyltransferase involved in cell wall biosynthesis
MGKQRKIRIAHIVLGLNYGGTEKSVIEIVNGLNEQEFESIIICLDFIGARRNDVTGNVAMYHVGRKPGIRIINFFLLYGVLKEAKADIIHFRNFTPYFWGCLAARLQKDCIIVYGEHGNIGAQIESCDWRAIAVRKALKYFTHHFLTNSFNFKNMLIEKVGLRQEKIIVVPNCVDSDKYYPVDRKVKKALRRKFGLSSEDFVIGIVANLRPVKNISLVIKAMLDIVCAIPSAKLVVVGEGKEKVSLKRLASCLNVKDRVVFMGLCEEVNELLNIFDVFILPSAYGEGMPNAILEAMAARVPVIASDIPGNREVLLNGKRGILFRNRDEDSLLRAILSIAKDESFRCEVAERGYVYVREHLKPSDMIERYEKFYRSIFLARYVKTRKLSCYAS